MGPQDSRELDGCCSFAPRGDGQLAAEPPPQAVFFQDKRPEERLRGATAVGRGWGLGLSGRAKLGAGRGWVGAGGSLCTGITCTDTPREGG